MQFIHVKWELWGELTLAIATGLDCAILILMSRMKYVIWTYILYVAFRVIYQMMITIAQ